MSRPKVDAAAAIGFSSSLLRVPADGRIREKTVMNRTVKEDVERRLDQYAPLRRRRRCREGEGELGAEREGILKNRIKSAHPARD